MPGLMHVVSSPHMGLEPQLLLSYLPAISQNESTFKRAFPWILGEHFLGYASFAICAASSSEIVQRVSLFANIIAFYSLLGTIACGLKYHTMPRRFEQNHFWILSGFCLAGTISATIDMIFWKNTPWSIWLAK